MSFLSIILTQTNKTKLGVKSMGGGTGDKKERKTDKKERGRIRRRKKDEIIDEGPTICRPLCMYKYYVSPQPFEESHIKSHSANIC